MIPTFPIKVKRSFPTASDDHAALWESRIGRAFLLLWRPCHLVNQHFWGDALALVAALEKEKPETLEQFREIFRRFEYVGGGNFTPGDIDSFLPEALPYLLGEWEVLWEFVD